MVTLSGVGRASGRFFPSGQPVGSMLWAVPAALRSGRHSAPASTAPTCRSSCQILYFYVNNNSPPKVCENRVACTLLTSRMCVPHWPDPVQLKQPQPGREAEGQFWDCGQSTGRRARPQAGA